MSYSKHRTLQEWMQLVTECRQSCMSDLAWCQEHSINIKSFYKAITRLRKKAFSVPANVRSCPAEDTAQRHDIVRVDVVPGHPGWSGEKATEGMPYIENPHTIEIISNGTTVHISNTADPALFSELVRILKGTSC